MLDKQEDDNNYEDEAYESSPQQKHADGNPATSQDPPSNEGGEAIEEEEMLDIAEKCFMRIAEAIIQRQLTVRQAFGKHIVRGT